MKQQLIILSLLTVIIAGATIVSCNNSRASNEKTITDATGFTYTMKDVEHGDYLIKIMGCDDCHSPKVFGPAGPELDMSRRLSGRRSDAVLPKADTAALKSWMLFANDLTAAVGPWGASFSANLTSDASGIGNWSLEQFKTAIRKGKYKGLETGRDLLPPMPWQGYKKLTDDDLKSIFAFLKSTMPVRNIVPAPIVPQNLK